MSSPIDREIGNLQARVTAHDTDLRSLEEKVDEHYAGLKAQLDRMEADATRQRGFIAGVVFLATCIGAVLGLFKDFIISHVFK